MISCPICSQELVHKNINDVEVDVCEVHGLWLDRSELLTITERERHETPSWMFTDLFRQEKRPPVDRHRTLSCPHCDADMKLEEYKSVMMDWCQEHGVWLDSGELEAIVNNLRLDPKFVGKVALRLWENKY